MADDASVAVTGERRAGPRRGTTGRDDRVLAWSALAVLAVVFLLVSLPFIRGSFGQSDEGLNDAVWGYGSRSYRELGPLTSALGGRRLDGRAYATHPPLLLTETALVESLVGEHRWSTRAPAWLGALASILLLYLLLRALDLARAPAAAATVATCGTAMFFTYGWMLDTPVTSLPFGLAVALVWQRARQRDRAAPVWLAVLVSFVCALSGWEATLFTCLLALWSLGEWWRARRTSGPGAATPAAAGPRFGLPYLAGAVAGFVVSVAWGLWVYGDLQHLLDKFLIRSSGEKSGLADLLAEQGKWTVLLLGVGLIGLGAAVAAVRDHRFRPLTAVALATVVVYDLVFRGGAAGHPFWNYWLLVATGVGYGYLFDRLYGQLARGRGAARRADLSVLGLAVLLALVGIAVPGAAKQNIEVGMGAVDVLRARGLPADQRELPYLGELVMPEDWMRYEFDVQGRPLSDPADLRAWARAHPDQLMLVSAPCAESDTACIALLGPPAADTSWVALTGQEALRRLGP